MVGRWEKHDRLDLVDAILYVVRTGCAWRALPSDYPPWQTVCYYFARWHDADVTERVHDALRGQARRQDERDVEPTAEIINAQSTGHPGQLRTVVACPEPAELTGRQVRARFDPDLGDALGAHRR